MLAAGMKDAKALEGMADLETFADEIFGFHAQQAAEKALKAWLCSLGLEHPRSHDLSLLVSTLRNANQNVDSLDELIELNPYAVQYRYDAFDDVSEPLDRDATMSRIAALLRRVGNLLIGTTPKCQE